MNPEENIAYLKRSYSAVDGLWFMMVEDELGFEKALEIDQKVWSVIPKIQARFLKESLGENNGFSSLKLCFGQKLLLDSLEFTVDEHPDELIFRITSCPWHETMIKSGREHLSHRIGETICTTEYSGWAKEFGDGISVEFQNRICTGGEACTVRFHQL